MIFEELDPAKHGDITTSLQLSIFDGKDYGCPPVFSNAVDEVNGATHTISSLKLLQFPAHLTAILSYTLNGYTTEGNGEPSLVVKFNPEATVRFSQEAMRNNRAIVTLELPKVSAIGQFAFDNNGGIKTLTFAPGSTLDSIGQRAFENCSALTTFTLPASVKFIENMAFYGLGSQVKDATVQFLFEEGSLLETIGNQAFAHSGIKSFVMPSSLTTIGSEVFKNAKIETLTISENLVIDTSSGGGIVQGCTTIKEIIVPDGHKTLSSFEGVLYDKHQTSLYIYPAAKDSLSYSIPDTVTYIAPGTFYQYKGTYLKLPKNLTGIDASAFEKSLLETIEIPAAVTTIGANAFKDCKNLRTITIPKDSKLTLIGVQAFYDTAITEIYLPDSVGEIGNQAFGSCDNLQSITLPKELKILPSSVFTGCRGLKTVTLNEGLETIGDNAFKYCNSLLSIEIPNSVTTIGQYAFHDCKALVEFICDDEASSLRYVGFSCFLNCISLEKVVFGPGVEVFGTNATGSVYDTFKGCTNLQEVVLPADLAKIPAGMFKNLNSLAKVTLPANLKELEKEAFLGCPNLTTITIPATVDKVGAAAFAESGLREVVFAPGSKLTSIPANMFAECTSLAKINLPASIVKIENGAFAMTALTEIDFPDELNSIGDQAFYGCDKLTAIVIPGNVLTIGASAFEKCSEVSTLVIADGVKDIGSFAFADCVKIESVSIPKSVKTIEDNPFTGCVGIKSFAIDPANVSFNYVDGVLYDSIGYSLIYYSVNNDATSFVIPEGVFEIKGGAFSGSKLEEIIFGSNVKAIPVRAFSGSESLKTVVITNTITSIGDGAFMDCTAIESISIPASVTMIGEAAFANCKNLSSFTIETRKTDLTVAAYLFFGCEKITTVYEFPGTTQFYPYMYAGTGITSLVIPEYITDLNVEGVFADSAVTSVKFPSKLKNYSTLGQNFFNGSALTTVTLPSAITTVGIGAFANCTDLESFAATHVNAIYDRAFEGCTALTTMNVNNGYNAHEGGVSLGKRALANCTSLRIEGSNIFNYVYSYNDEALLNCVGLVGELALSSQTNLIGNYAFSGCTGITKISVSGRDFYLNANTFSGLTANTTVYFTGVTSYDALVSKLGSDTGWSTSTEAKFAYYTPSGNVEVTLTDDELKLLDQYVEKGIIAKEMMETVKSKWLEYKGSFNTLAPADELTKDEIIALDSFIEECKIKIDPVELQKLWTEYRKTLAKELTNHPKYFTADELASFDEISQKMDETVKAAFMQKWFEYKLSYSDANPSSELSKEDIEALKLFCGEIGLDDNMMVELQNRWPEYRKTLAAGLVTPVYIDLTDEEYKALEMFCKQWEIPDAIESLKLEWMQYKGALVITGKEDAKELSADEILLVKTMVETYGIEPKAATEFEEKLLKYKQDYASIILEKVSLNDEENKMVEEFIQNAGLDKTVIDSVREDFVNYKKAFLLSGFQPGKELSQEETEAYNDFMAKYNVDAKIAEKFIGTFMEYRLKLAGM